MSTSALSSQRWRRLIPLAFVTYSLAYVDRSNYSLGAAGGLTHSLHITSSQAGLLGGLFFIGYFVFQVPAAEFAERRSVKRLMFWSLILWGIFAALQGVLRSFPLLLADRFLLGVVEAAVIPAMLVFLTHWFSSRERGRADTFLILGNPVTLLWMSVISGYLITATSYRFMLIIEGLPAIAWAFVFRALSADRPRDAKWLGDTERSELEGRLSAEQANVPKVAGYREVLASWNVRVLALQYALWSIGVYGFVFWLPTIVKSQSGNGIGSTGALSAIPYALAVILMLANSYVSDRAPAPATVRVAVFDPRRDRVLPLLSRGHWPLRGVLRAAGHRRRRDVCAIWTVLRVHPGIPAPERLGSGDGRDQRVRGAGRVRRCLHRRGARRRHEVRGGVHLHGCGHCSRRAF